MTVLHAIDTERKLLLTVFRGPLSDEDVREHLRMLRANPQFQLLMRELVDLRGVTDVTISSAMARVSARWLLHAPDARRAIVAPSDVLFGLARMYQTHLGEIGAAQLGVFRAIEPALRWLGLSDEQELPTPPSV